MEKRIEAYLDQHARKLIAEELRLLYGAEEDVPDDFLELLQLLKEQRRTPRVVQKIRSDEGTWIDMEQFITERSKMKFSHGMCPDCERRVSADERPSNKPTDR